MRSVIFIFLASSLFLCAVIPADDTSCRAERDFVNPAASQPEADGWERYTDIVTVTKKNVDGLNPGNVSPEAALVQFYASLIRNDECFRIALPPGKADSDLRNSIDKVTSWKFHEIRLEKRKKLSDDMYWISLWMKIEFRGKTESGTDDATLRKIGGKWYIVAPPT